MDAREIAEKHTILRAVVGSTAHGLNLPGQDDKDEMGVCIEPPEYVIGLQRFEQWIYRTQPDYEKVNQFLIEAYLDYWTWGKTKTVDIYGALT